MIRLRDLVHTDLFYDLIQHDEIIIYETKDKFYKKLCRKFLSKKIEICCFNNDLLKRRLLFDLILPDLPVGIYFGYVLTNNDKLLSCIDYIDNIKYDLLEQKVNRLIYLNKITVFIKGSLENQKSESFDLSLTILNQMNYNFEDIVFYNVLLNERLQNYVIDMCRCNKFPVIYIDGTFIGELDLMEEVYLSNRLKKIIK